MLTRTWCLLIVCALIGAARPAGAASGPVSEFVRAERALAQAPLSFELLPTAQQNPTAFLGQVFAVTATVGGLVTADGDRTALLSVGGLSLPARVSAADAAWLDSGQTIRALLRVEAEGNDLSLSNLRVLAAAPEAQVALWERTAEPMVWASRGTSLPSRSLPYQRQPASVPNTPGGLVTNDALMAKAQALYWPYRNTIQRLNPRLAEAALDTITRSILGFSAQNRIDPRLVMAMVIAESGFDTYSTSRTGAMGLGQLMPGTARGLGVTNAYDPVQNIAAATRLLRGHLDQYGGAPADAGLIPINQILLTMAAYNAGPGAVRKYHGVPPYRETRRYVAKVAALYKQMLLPEERATLR